jgi:predicted GNAT family acetyltransferase
MPATHEYQSFGEDELTGEAAMEVTNRPEHSRYELRVDGELAGIVEYRDRARGGLRTFTHTLVSPLFEGRGLASHLARAALDDARAEGLKIVPLCPFIAGYIATHPEYADLVRA